MGAPLLQARDAASLTIALSADDLQGRTQIEIFPSKREIAPFLTIEPLLQAERFVPRRITRCTCFDDLLTQHDDH